MRICYLHTSSPKYIRVDKFINSFLEKGDKITFFGAMREGEKWKDEVFAINSNIRFKHGLKSIFSLFMYIYKASRFIRNTNPDVVIVTNEELYLAVIAAGYKGYVVLEAIDALDIRSRKNIIFDKVTKLARSQVNLIVEVEDFRKERFPKLLDKTVVVRNIPTVNYSSLDLQLPEKYIFAYGSLREGINGIEQLIKATEELNEEGKNFSIVIAGYIDGLGLDRMVSSSPHVRFLGKLTHGECMTIGKSAKALFAYYKPVNVNFVMAAPNKYYEALLLGKPLLINSETKISREIASKGEGYASEYENVEVLKKNLETILSEYENPIQKSSLSWEVDFNKFYKRLSDESSSV